MMGNPRSFTTKFNARKAELEAFVHAKVGRSILKRRAAYQRAASPIRPPVREGEA